MAEFDTHTRKVISDRLQEQRNKRIQKLSARERALAEEIIYQYYGSRKQIDHIAQQFRQQKDIKPSQWFCQHTWEEKKPFQWFGKRKDASGSYAHKELLDAFVPEKYQDSYL